MKYWCQLCQTHGSSHCGWSYIEVLWKLLEKLHFLKIFKTFWQTLPTKAAFGCFLIQYSHIIIFHLNLSKLTHFLSSNYCSLMHCEPAFSVYIFCLIWSPKITENVKLKLRISKNKILMTNMTVCMAFITKWAVKKTEITEMLAS